MRIQSIFETILKIFKTQLSPASHKTFGIFGGGGRFGSVTHGSEGISGSGGSVGGAGIIFGTAGSVRLRDPRPILKSGQRIFGGRGSVSGWGLRSIIGIARVTPRRML